MPFLRRPSFFTLSLLVPVTALAVVSCSGDEEGARRGNGLAAPQNLSGAMTPVPALNIAPAHGLKDDVFLSAELAQAMAQIQGVEQSLGQLHNDLQGTAAALARVDAMRQEVDALNIRFEALRERLAFNGPQTISVPPAAIGPVTTTVTETVTDLPPPAPAAAPVGPTPLTGEMAAPAASMTPMKPVTEAPKAKASDPARQPAVTGEGVRAVRVGEHADRVRIVFDIAGHANGYTTNLDAAEKLLTVELPKTKWAAGASQSFARNPVLASYTGQDNGSGGSLVAFALKGPTRVLSSSVLKAEGGRPARLVIDLAR